MSLSTRKVLLEMWLEVLECPQCSEGELMATRSTKPALLPRDKPLRKHKCHKCDHFEWLKGRAYPIQHIVRVDPDRADYPDWDEA